MPTLSTATPSRTRALSNLNIRNLLGGLIRPPQPNGKKPDAQNGARCAECRMNQSRRKQRGAAASDARTSKWCDLYQFVSVNHHISKKHGGSHRRGSWESKAKRESRPDLNDRDPSRKRNNDCSSPSDPCSEIFLQCTGMPQIRNPSDEEETDGNDNYKPRHVEFSPPTMTADLVAPNREVCQRDALISLHDTFFPTPFSCCMNIFHSITLWLCVAVVFGGKWYCPFPGPQTSAPPMSVCLCPSSAQDP